MANPSVMIIVVNWNNRVDTVETLLSLQEIDYGNYTILVVDNGSTDGSPDAITVHFPKVALVQTGSNLGYAGGNNVGLKLFLASIDTEYALILNNDVVVARDLLARLVQCIQFDDTIGVVTPSIYYRDRPNLFWAAGGMVDLTQMDIRICGVNEEDIGQYTCARDVDFGLGCAMLVRRSVVDQVGLLDERFFLYHEEVEWCTRVRRARYRIVHDPKSRVWHKTRPAESVGPVYQEYYQTRNLFLLLVSVGAGPEAWWNCLYRQVLRPVVTWSLFPRYRHLRPQRDARLRGLRDFLLRRFGPQQCN